MIAAALPWNEASRLECVRALAAIDLNRDHSLDLLVRRALSLFPRADSAVVSLLNSDQQMFRASVGRDWRATPRSQSFCAHTILSSGVMFIEDAGLDERFHDNPLVIGDPGIRFYAGAALRDNVGALCVIGLEPCRATQAELDGLADLACAVGHCLARHTAIGSLARQIELR